MKNIPYVQVASEFNCQSNNVVQYSGSSTAAARSFSFIIDLETDVVTSKISFDLEEKTF